MKFSIVNGQRQEAQPNLAGECPVCAQAMIAKCGEVNIWHWAHKGRCVSDPWWENETEWHRAWKGEFPASWQEIVHHADSGEKHIADVKTDHGWVIEFQHSPIKPEERRSRDAFYPKLAWVVNGVRRKRDSEKFHHALIDAMHDGSNAWMRIPFADECAILRDWAGGNAPVFLDFGPGLQLWCILGRTPTGSVDVAPFSRSDLLEIFRDGATQKSREFEDFVNSFRKTVSKSEPQPLAQASNSTDVQPASGVPQYRLPILRRRRRL